jgi:phosphocarrier protein
MPALLQPLYKPPAGFIKDGVEADGKSILGILSFAASKGTNITVLTDGEDADIALNTIEELIESGFEEGV